MNREPDTEQEVLFSRYKVLRLLGRGGGGSVYFVEDLEKNRANMALKIVELPEDGEEEFDLIRNEFEILARRRHPYLAPAYEIGREGGTAYFTMEYIPGPTLLDAVARFDLPEIIRLAVQLLRALAFLHNFGLVHGDVKPQNVLVDTSRRPHSVRLLDLGLAESAMGEEARKMWGTPAYMAPEKYYGSPPDPRSDLYGFGVTLFQLVTGRLPFRGETNTEILRQHLLGKPPAPSSIEPSLPRGLDEICLKLLEKEPRWRYPSAEAVIASLAPFGSGATVEPPHDEGRHLVTAAFVGRDKSLEELEGILGPALERDGPHAAAVLMGPGGAGKSRLAREFALNARVKGCRVIETFCARNQRFPLEPLAELARPLSQEVEALEPAFREPVRALLGGRLGTEPGWEKRRVREGVGTVFDSASRRTGLLLVLEDFHLAPPELVEVVLDLAGNKSGHGRALLLTAEERFEDPRSGRMFPAGKADSPVKAVHLPPFGGREVSEWVKTALPGATLPVEVAERIAGWAKGNPLLIREALLAAIEDGRFISSMEGWQFEPPSPGDMFPPAGLRTGRRFSALTQEERGVVGALALHPGDLKIGFLKSVLKTREGISLLPMLRGLARNGWVVETRRGRTFTLFHEHMRRPVMRAIEGEERIRIHEELARVLEAAADLDESVVAAVAEHWARAGAHEKAADWCFRAGDSPFRQTMPRRAMRFLRAAKRAALAAGWDARRTAEIEFLMAGTFIYLGNPGRAESILRETGKRRLPLSVRAKQRYELGRALIWQGRNAEALSTLQESERLMGETGDSEGRLKVLLLIADALPALGRTEEALGMLAKALELCGDDLEVRGSTLISMGKTLGELGRGEEAFARIIEGIRVIRKSRGAPLILISAYLQLGHIRLSQGELGKALRWYRVFGRASKRMEFLPGIAFASGMAAITAWGAGNPALAYEEIRMAERVGGRIGDAHLIVGTIGFLLQMAKASGRHDLWLQKMRHAEKLLSLSEKSPSSRLLPHQFRPAFLLRAGMYSKTREAIDRGRPILEKVNPKERIGPFLAEMTLALETGHPERALTLASKAERKPSFSGPPLMRVLLAKARALAGLGRNEEARAAFGEALERNIAGGHLGNAVEIRFHRARWALSTGEISIALAGALQVVEEGRKAGQIALVWQALHLAGRSLEALGEPGRAAKFYRRALWAMEAEAMAFPEPYRSSFMAKDDTSDLAGRAMELRAEETALRLTGFACARASSSGGGPWSENAVAWAGACAGLLGADAVRFDARWQDAQPSETVFGKPTEPDETWTIECGGGGMRPVSVTLHRRWERGSFLPVARRMATVLTARLTMILERDEWRAKEARFDRAERAFQERIREAETTIATTRRALSATQTAFGQSLGYGEIIGTSAPMRKVYDLIQRFAPLDITVLVTGESGTGKELVARAIHSASPRSSGPFFAVNCAAVAEPLLESELFGHEKGAYTGADETRPGLFEQSCGGTLVLDEVADMSPRMQAQVLRALEEKQVRRLGGTHLIPVDIRVLALSNRPIEKEVEAGRFRMDLYHRLNQALITLPPLRARAEDIPLLAEYFLSEPEAGPGPSRLSRKVFALLMNHNWPGNVRELRNQIKRASLLSRGRSLTPEDFPDLGKRVVTETAINSNLVAKLRAGAAREGFAVKPRHEDLLRILSAGGKIQREEFEQMTGISKPTAARDLERLVSLGLIRRIGRGRATVYEIEPAVLGRPRRRR